MTSNGNPASRIDDIITTMQHNANAFNQIVATLTSRRKVLQFLDERLTPHLFYVPVALPAATAAGSPEAGPAAGSPAADSLRVCIITDAKFVFCHDARDDSMQRVMVFKVSEFRIAEVQHLSPKQAAVMSEAALNTISQQLEDALGRADALEQKQSSEVDAAVARCVALDSNVDKDLPRQKFNIEHLLCGDDTSTPTCKYFTTR